MSNKTAKCVCGSTFSIEDTPYMERYYVVISRCYVARCKNNDCIQPGISAIFPTNVDGTSLMWKKLADSNIAERKLANKFKKQIKGSNSIARELYTAVERFLKKYEKNKGRCRIEKWEYEQSADTHKYLWNEQSVLHKEMLLAFMNVNYNIVKVGKRKCSLYWGSDLKRIAHRAVRGVKYENIPVVVTDFKFK